MLLQSKQLIRVGFSYYARKAKLFSFRNLQTFPSQLSHNINISDSCVEKLKQLCGSSDSFLRLCVESGGCSGFQYKFDIDNKLAADDRVFEKDGTKVVVDETSLQFINGATIDYHTELIRSAFRVIGNPNADVGCSCGASFSIKID